MDPIEGWLIAGLMLSAFILLLGEFMQNSIARTITEFVAEGFFDVAKAFKLYRKGG